VILKFRAVHSVTPKRAGSADVLDFSRWRENLGKSRAGMEPRAFQLETAEGPTSAISAATLAPIASTTASTDVKTIPPAVSPAVNKVNSHAAELDAGRQSGDNRHMSMASESIAKRLQMTRDALELIDADICRGIGVKPNRWSQYVTGARRITVEVADLLCDRYSLTLDWIYRGNPAGLPSSLAKRLDTNQAA
jgi:hypothetical protein